METRIGYDRAEELKAFDETKAGVKGLVDAGTVTVPAIFHVSPEDILSEKFDDDLEDIIQVPIIDLRHALDPAEHEEIVGKMRLASEEWGFFQVINHGIPQAVLKKVIDGVRRFHEQPREEKMKFYTREAEKKVKFNSNYDLYQSKTANWRDTLFCVMAPNPPPQHEYPATCSEALIEYSEHVQSLGQILFGLLSEALGLNASHLTDMGCMEGHSFVCHYYPACPEPDRTIGHAKHCDPDFLTVLLQDQIGGLQVLHQDRWIDIPPLEGALIVNIGDLLQLVSNDKLRSSEHRVLAKCEGPRISVACFFTTHFQASNKLYGPISELLSDDNPPLYKQTSIKDYFFYQIRNFIKHKIKYTQKGSNLGPEQNKAPKAHKKHETKDHRDPETLAFARWRQEASATVKMEVESQDQEHWSTKRKGLGGRTNLTGNPRGRVD